MLKSTSPILITDASLQNVFDNAPPNQDLRLAVCVDCLQDAPAGTQEVFIWDFFDEYGNVIPNREASQVAKPEKGSFVYNIKYQAPAGKPGEFAMFTLAWLNGQTGQILDRLQLVRVVLVAGAPQNKARALNETKGKVESRSKGVENAAAAIGSAFSAHDGAKGLKVKIQSKEADGKVKFEVQANRDCSAILLDLSSSGDLSMLAPMKGQKPLKLKANEKTAVPAGGEGFTLSGPEGVEMVAVLALEDPGKPAAPAAEAGKTPEKGKEPLGKLFEKKP
ncbi:MAG: DUF4384 domain-containing protein [Candidatus Sumerlaeota bacterium]|nr:DUF4384 domain-containing protein [Candidatus Sumerlaeota bacterium]